MNARKRATIGYNTLWAWATAVLLLVGGTAWADEIDDQFAVAAGHYDRRQWKLAVEEFRDFLQSHPNDRRVGLGEFFLGEAFLQLGNYGEARQRFQQYILREPEGKFVRPAMFRVGEAAYLSEKLEDAKNDLERFRSKYGEDKLNAFVLPYLGEIALAGNDVAQATALFREGLARFPDGRLQDDCRIGLAKALERQNQSEEAERLYAAVAAKTDSPLADSAQFYLGSLQYAGGKYKQSIESFSSLEDRASDSPWKPNARLGHGLALLKQDQPELAIPLLQSVADDPKLGVEARYWIGLAQKARKDWGTAAKGLLALAEANPNHDLTPAMRFHAGDAWLNAGELPAAIQQFDAVIALPAGKEWSQQAARGKIQASLQTKDYATVDRAATDFDRQFPDSALKPDVQRLLARSLIEQKDWTRAVAILEPMLHSAGREPTDLENRYLLALVYDGLNRHEDSQTTLQPVLQSAAASLKTDAQLAHGSSLMASKRYAEALVPLEAFCATKLSDGDAKGPSGDAAAKGMGELAICYARTNQLDKAKKVFAELAEKYAQHPLLLPTIEQLAEAAYDANDATWSAELSARLSKAGSSDAYSLKGKMGLAWSQFKAGRLEEAAATFEQVLKAEPAEAMAAEAAMVRGQILDQLKQSDSALVMYTVVIDKYPKSKQHSDALLAAARLCAKQKQYDAAIAHYQRLATADPKPSNLDAVLYEWAWTLQEAGKADEAAKLFQELHASYPQSPYWADATYRLAQRAFESKDYEQSAKLIAPLLKDKSDPRVGEYAAYLRGQIAAARADWPATREAFETFTKTYPDSPRRLTADYWIAETFYRQNDFDTAHTRFEPLANQGDVQREPWMAMIPLRRAQISIQRNQWEDASRIASTIAADFPGFDQQHEVDYVLGRCLAHQAQFDEAREVYNRVIRSPLGSKTETAAMAQWMVGETYFHQKNYEAALREYLRLEILYAYPTWQAAALLQAGKCHELLGDPKEAMELYKRIVKSYPNTPFVEQARKKLQETEGQRAATIRDP